MRMPKHRRSPSHGSLRCGFVIGSLLALVSPGPATFAGRDDGARSQGRTGIELVLASRSLRVTPPQWWEVTDAASQQRVIRVEQRWGFAPLPPGTYQIEAELGGVKGSARDVV